MMSHLRNHFDTLIFQQPFTKERLGLVRISIGFVILLLVLAGPYDHFFIDNVQILTSLDTSFPFLSPLGFVILKTLVIVFSIALLFGICCRFSCLALSFCFLVLNYYTSSFTSGTWNYDTHLNFFLFFLSFADITCYSMDSFILRSKKIENPFSMTDSFLLFFMQFFVGVLYFQSGLAKILRGGWEWVATGRTLFLYTYLMGTKLGYFLLNFKFLFPVFSVITIVFEIGFIFFLLFKPNYHRLLGIFAILFHTAVYLVMGISFWHLFLLYPALFIFNNS